MDEPRVLIAGGTGVFGRLLAHEVLATTAARVLVAARDGRRAAAVCDRMGPRATPLALDLRDLAAVERAARGAAIVACAAGPFQTLDRAAVGAVTDAGAHWVDLADDPAWVLPLLDDAGHARDVAVVPGASTTPALSGALARWAHRRLPGAARARVTLLIGNRNDKGAAAIYSALAGAFTDPVDVRTPSGARRAYRFPSADEALLERALGVRAEFRVALGWEPAALVAAAAARRFAHLGPRARAALARSLALGSRPFGLVGTSTGALQVDLWDGTGRYAAAALVGEGQRMAILPAATIVRALLERPERGVIDAAERLRVDRLDGLRLLVGRQGGSKGPTQRPHTGDSL